MVPDDDDKRFLPPEMVNPPRPPELEEAWVKEKAAKIEAAKHRQPARRPLMIGGVLAALVAIAVVTTGVVMLMKQKPAQQAADPGSPALPATPNLAGIEIRSKPPAQIKIDGHKAGRTPLTLHVPKSGTPVKIEATAGGNTQTREVVPDHDQLVDFLWK